MTKAMTTYSWRCWEDKSARQRGRGRGTLGKSKLTTPWWWWCWWRWCREHVWRLDHRYPVISSRWEVKTRALELRKTLMHFCTLSIFVHWAFLHISYFACWVFLHIEYFCTCSIFARLNSLLFLLHPASLTPHYPKPEDIYKDRSLSWWWW